MKSKCKALSDVSCERGSSSPHPDLRKSGTTKKYLGTLAVTPHNTALKNEIACIGGRPGIGHRNACQQVGRGKEYEGRGAARVTVNNFAVARREKN